MTSCFACHCVFVHRCSPELVQGEMYDAKSDVWAAGCLLYELMTLRHPFNAANQAALLMSIMRGKFEPVQKFGGVRTRTVCLCVCVRARVRACERACCFFFVSYSFILFFPYCEHLHVTRLFASRLPKRRPTLM